MSFVDRCFCVTLSDGRADGLPQAALCRLLCLPSVSMHARGTQYYTATMGAMPFLGCSPDLGPPVGMKPKTLSRASIEVQTRPSVMHCCSDSLA